MIRLPLEQKVNCGGVAVVTGIVQWGPLSVVQSHDVSALSQQELEALLTAFSAGQVQRCALLLVSGFDVGVRSKKTIHNLVEVVHGGEVQGSLELVGE